jgi:hypothetical protein
VLSIALVSALFVADSEDSGCESEQAVSALSRAKKQTHWTNLRNIMDPNRCEELGGTAELPSWSSTSKFKQSITEFALNEHGSQVVQLHLGIRGIHKRDDSEGGRNRIVKEKLLKEKQS